jgi:hypothetical protein
MPHEPNTQSQNVPSSVRSRPSTNEGEGNKTAARRYNRATEEYVEAGKVDRAATAAKEALESDEGSELERAEEEGKAEATPVEREADAKGLADEREAPQGTGRAD